MRKRTPRRWPRCAAGSWMGQEARHERRRQHLFDLIRHFAGYTASAVHSLPSRSSRIRRHVRRLPVAFRCGAPHDRSAEHRQAPLYLRECRDRGIPCCRGRQRGQLAFTVTPVGVASGAASGNVGEGAISRARVRRRRARSVARRAVRIDLRSSPASSSLAKAGALSGRRRHGPSARSATAAGRGRRHRL